jgi:hypothetical protein
MNWVRWSMGELSLHGIGHLLGVPQSVTEDCYPCTPTKLLPMSPDCTDIASNQWMERTLLASRRLRKDGQTPRRSRAAQPHR